ncbi:MAG: Trp biosynthesis-associated membrane protein [Nocardioides sp.]
MRDRTFGPVVLGGLASAALSAVGSASDWATATGDNSGVAASGAADGARSAPLALALSLVALAAWGVLLVLRGRVRRLVAALGVVAAAGVVLATVAAFPQVRDDAVESAQAAGATSEAFTSALTGWYWVTAVAAVLSTAALVVAVLKAPGWPAMGARYDNPAVAREAAPASEEDLWKALDEGRDPTA